MDAVAGAAGGYRPRAGAVVSGPLLTIPRGYLVNAALAIDDAAEKYPMLSANGWTTGNGKRQPLVVENVATSLLFILYGPVARVRIPKWSSYSGKHGAEIWGKELGFSPYVSNGDFLAACLYTNIAHRRCNDLSPNSIVALKLIDARLGSLL